MTEYLMIGEVLKPQGIHGECKIRPYCADPEQFRRWSTLYTESEGARMPLACRVRRIHEGYVYAVLGDCASMEEAERLRGVSLYIDRAHATPLSDGEVYIADLIGCDAVDEQGRVLGSLTEVLQNGPVDTWVFRGEKGGFMVPALKAVFPDVDPVARRISVVSARLEEVAVFEN